MRARIKVISPNGFEIELETPEVESRQKMLEILPRFEDELLELGYSPISQPASQPAASVSDHSFAVDKITATVDGEKIYWRAKGGEFQKFGVIVYPEVLEAAGLGELNPLKPYTESGLVAYYAVKDDGVKPKKVVRFERGN